MGHWERLTMIEAVKKYSGVDFNDWKNDEDAIAAAKADPAVAEALSGKTVVKEIYVKGRLVNLAVKG